MYQAAKAYTFRFSLRVYVYICMTFPMSVAWQDRKNKEMKWNEMKWNEMKWV
jgi:hypothetical protein